jgi:hypothetical protein
LVASLILTDQTQPVEFYPDSTDGFGHTFRNPGKQNGGSDDCRSSTDSAEGDADALNIRCRFRGNMVVKKYAIIFVNILGILFIFPLYYFVNYFKIHSHQRINDNNMMMYFMIYLLFFIVDILWLIIQGNNIRKYRETVDTYLGDDYWAYNPMTGAITIIMILIGSFVLHRAARFIIWGI